MNVGKKILEYLRMKDISQSYLAEKLKIKQQSISRLLNSNDIKLSQLIEITKALELPVTYFFDGKEHNGANEEIEGYKKRIAELEEMLGDKRQIIATRQKHDIEQVKKALNEILENEYKTLSNEDKKEAYEIVISEAKNATNGISTFYDLNKRSEIIELIHNDLINPKLFSKEGNYWTKKNKEAKNTKKPKEIKPGEIKDKSKPKKN